MHTKYIEVGAIYRRNRALLLLMKMSLIYRSICHYLHLQGFLSIRNANWIHHIPVQKLTAGSVVVFCRQCQLVRHLATCQGLQTVRARINLIMWGSIPHSHDTLFRLSSFVKGEPPAVRQLWFLRCSLVSGTIPLPPCDGSSGSASTAPPPPYGVNTSRYPKAEFSSHSGLFIRRICRRAL
jgi:hypothetical protein